MKTLFKEYGLPAFVLLGVAFLAFGAGKLAVSMTPVESLNPSTQSFSFEFEKEASPPDVKKISPVRIEKSADLKVEKGKNEETKVEKTPEQDGEENQDLDQKEEMKKRSSLFDFNVFTVAEKDVQKKEIKKEDNPFPRNLFYMINPSAVKESVNREPGPVNSWRTLSSFDLEKMFRFVPVFKFDDLKDEAKEAFKKNYAKEDPLEKLFTIEKQVGSEKNGMKKFLMNVYADEGKNFIGSFESEALKGLPVKNQPRLYEVKENYFRNSERFFVLEESQGADSLKIAEEIFSNAEESIWLLMTAYGQLDSNSLVGHDKQAAFDLYEVSPDFFVTNPRIPASE